MNKKISSLIFILIAFISCSHPSTSNPYISVMSFNIRYDNPGDGKNAWSERKADVVHLIKKYHPDFLGIQEGLHHQVMYIKENIPDFDFIGKGRDDGKTKGEYAALFFNNKKYKLLNQETFWLSSTPDQISVGWDASMERICTYGVFENYSSKKILHVFNAHFDHIGPEARFNSAKLILKKIKDLNLEEQRIVVMGDFNAEPKSDPISTFASTLDDGLTISTNTFKSTIGTFNNFDSNVNPDRRIDYIFTKNLSVFKYEHINDKRSNGLCVSDHLPILVEIH